MVGKGDYVFSYYIVSFGRLIEKYAVFSWLTLCPLTQVVRYVVLFLVVAGSLILLNEVRYSVWWSKKKPVVEKAFRDRFKALEGYN